MSNIQNSKSGPIQDFNTHEIIFNLIDSASTDTMATTWKEHGDVSIYKAIKYPLNLPGAATAFCSRIEEVECSLDEDELGRVSLDQVEVGLLELAESAVPSCRYMRTPSRAPGAGTTMPGWRPSPSAGEQPSRGKVMANKQVNTTSPENPWSREMFGGTLDIDNGQGSIWSEELGGGPLRKQMGLWTQVYYLYGLEKSKGPPKKVA